MAWGQSRAFAGPRSVTREDPAQATTALEWATRPSWPSGSGRAPEWKNTPFAAPPKSCQAPARRFLDYVVDLLGKKQFGLICPIYPMLHDITVLRSWNSGAALWVCAVCVCGGERDQKRRPRGLKPVLILELYAALKRRSSTSLSASLPRSAVVLRMCKRGDCHPEEADDSRRVQSAAEAAAENMRLIAALKRCATQIKVAD